MKKQSGNPRVELFVKFETAVRMQNKQANKLINKQINALIDRYFFWSFLSLKSFSPYRETDNNVYIP